MRSPGRFASRPRRYPWPVPGGTRTSRARSVAVAVLVGLLALVTALESGGASAAGHADAARTKVGDGQGGIVKRKVGTFAAPTYVTHAPGAPALLYVVESGGRVAVVDHGDVRGRPFLDIHDRVSSGGERGLLSVAFDPRYGRNHFLYAYYTNRRGNIEIDEFHAASNLHARSSSRRRVIVIPHPRRSMRWTTWTSAR